MRYRPRLLLDTVAALAIGAAGVVWGLHVVETREQMIEQDVPPGDRAQGAVAELRQSDVYVAPDGRSMMSTESERALEATIARSPVPVHVVVWRPSKEAGGDPYSFALSETFAEELGEPGSYIVWQGPDDADAATAPGTVLAHDVPGLVEVGDAATRITEFVEALDEDSVVVDESDEFDYWGGTVGGVLIGLLYGSGIALAAWAALGFLRAATGRPFLNRPPKEG